MYVSVSSSPACIEIIFELSTSPGLSIISLASGTVKNPDRTFGMSLLLGAKETSTLALAAIVACATAKKELPPFGSRTYKAGLRVATVASVAM